MVTTTVKSSSQRQTIRGFLGGIFSFVGFVVLIHVLIATLLVHAVLFGVITGVFLSTGLGPVFH